MLKAIGVKNADDLYRQIPPSLRLKAPLNLVSGLSEFKLKEELSALSEENRPLSKFRISGYPTT